MAAVRSVHDLHALTLQWHSAASCVELEAFQAWALTMLKPVIAFEGAIWGLDAQTGDAASADADALPLGSVHLHRIAATAIEGYAAWRHGRVALEGGPGQVARVSIADARWQGERHAAVRAHAQRHGLLHSISVRAVDAAASGPQFLMLSRSAQPFNAAESRDLALLAPHLMLAFATRRRLAVAQSHARRRLTASAALVDLHGGIHDPDANFVEMLRREWSDWPGLRLPSSLQGVALRRAGRPWRFVGEQVTADFSPVHDMFLVTARPRHAHDVLTLRERDIAQHYASGMNYRQIAGALALSPATVRSHLRNVFAKLKINDKAQLAVFLQ